MATNTNEKDARKAAYYNNTHVCKARELLMLRQQKKHLGELCRQLRFARKERFSMALCGCVAALCLENFLAVQGVHGWGVARPGPKSLYIYIRMFWLSYRVGRN